MKHVYYENKEIPMPSNSHVIKKDGRVFIFANDGRTVRTSSRITIGHATSTTHMHPNENFRQLYPDLWMKYYGTKVPSYIIHPGMYALTLGIGYSTGIYPLIQSIYGPLHGNFLMDYAMYSIIEHSNVLKHFDECMESKAFFSEKLLDDSTAGELLKKLDHNLSYEFRRRWLEKCASDGIIDCWISIDGSNNDCDADCTLAEQGMAKSKTNNNIIAYMYAVSSDDGRPLTYEVYNGGLVDSKGIMKLISQLSTAGIKVSGIIVDRGFCTHEVISLLKELAYPYIVMLKGNQAGHTAMMKEYAETIRWNLKYAVHKRGLFGICEKKKIFGNHDDEAYINLFFDGKNGSERFLSLMYKVMDEADRLQESILQGKKVVVPQKYSKYIQITEKEGTYELELDTSRWQNDSNAKGFSSIASSEDLGPKEVNHLYHLRDASETQYNILKTQLGFHVTRAHDDAGIRSRFFVAFVAMIIRSEIQNACSKYKLSTNSIIDEMDRIEFRYERNGTYSFVKNISLRQEHILSEFDIIQDDFEELARDYNNRLLNPIHSQVRTKPMHTEPEKASSVNGSNGQREETECKMHSSDKETTISVVTRRPKGRPPGSKNKATLAKEAAIQAAGGLPPKRGKGRPPGSKNKATLEKEAATQVAGSLPPKRGKGRPPGSKNKTTLEKEAAILAVGGLPSKRGKGRPPGSKNKATLEKEAVIQVAGSLSPKRGKGRPPGSKNKKTK